MVFFICDVCNECLKKAKVEQHTYQCRQAHYFHCMDCNQRFDNQTYKAHQTCLTESQKYEGQFADQRAKKGDVKQKQWLAAILETIHQKPDSMPLHLRDYASRLADYDNVPRKRAKFVNFVKNSLNLRADPKGIAEALWGVIESAIAPAAPAPSSAANEVAPVEGAVEPVDDVGLKRDCGGANVTKGKVSKREAKAAKKEAKEAEKEAKKMKGADKAAKEEAALLAAAEKLAQSKAETPKADGDECAKGASKANKASNGASKRERGASGAAEGGLKPIKWKKVIAKELESEGGTMSLKALRKATVAEVRAHPTYTGREKESLLEEFDREIVRFHKFVVAVKEDGVSWVSVAKPSSE